MGTILFRYDHDWLFAERELRRALALSPHDVVALDTYRQFLTVVCRHAEAIDVARRQLAVDPANGDAALGWVLLRAGRPDEAIVHYQKALTLQSAAWPRANLAAAYSVLGRHAEATRQCDEVVRVPSIISAHALCANIYTVAGQRSLGSQIAEDLATRAGRQNSDPYFVGAAFLSLDPARALDWFEKAYDERASNIVGGLRHNPWIQSVEGNARWQNLVARMGYPRAVDHR